MNLTYMSPPVINATDDVSDTQRFTTDTLMSFVIDPSCLVYNVCIPCGHCYNGREECNFQTGECKVDCKPGWEYKNCSVRCRRLTYGFRCNHICNCTGECACNAETGHCDDHCVIYMNDNAYVFAVHARLQETLQLLPIILPTLIVAMTIATIIFGWRRRKAKHERMLFSFKPFGENEMKFLSATNKPPQ